MFAPVSNKGDLVRDSWPDDCARLAKENEPSASLEWWKVIPYEFTKLFDWAVVAEKEAVTDRSRSHQLLYAVESRERLFPVCIRLQGVVSNFSLAPLGTWDG